MYFESGVWVTVPVVDVKKTHAYEAGVFTDIYAYKILEIYTLLSLYPSNRWGWRHFIRPSMHMFVHAQAKAFFWF